MRSDLIDIEMIGDYALCNTKVAQPPDRQYRLF